MSALTKKLASFAEFGQATRRLSTSFYENGSPRTIDTFVNEFWTAKQRQANSLHEVSYRACFKPQLPRFFIERLTSPGDVVYDPFMGRGTTPIEAALLGRVPWGNDINPLSLTMTRPRLRPPSLDELAARLEQIDLTDHDEFPEDLLPFYHPDTLREICALKKYFSKARQLHEPRSVKRKSTNRKSSPSPPQKEERAGGEEAPYFPSMIPEVSHTNILDPLDDWLCMVSLNRLTGHSPGFFSVYTMPPNQAVSAQSQRKINERRNQTPPRRDIIKILLKKSKQLLGDCSPDVRRNLDSIADKSRFQNHPAAHTPELPANSVSLVVTSPPFLNIVQYADDNWLRCWFLGIDAKSVKLTVPRKLDAWQAAMTDVFRELHRILKPGGHVAFEVGEVHGGKTKLEEAVLPAGAAAGLEPVLVLINDQKFTKTANCWGVDNNFKGTNTNRIVLFRK